MLNKSVNFGLLGLLAALSLTNSAIAEQHQHSPSAPADMTNTMPQPQGDQRFITMMIHHDQKTLKMADLALQKAKNPQIKALATEIKTEQTKEIEQLQAFYKQLYGAEVPAGVMNCMGMGNGQGMGKNMSLESLENSPNFDQEFLQKMIHHQQMSVKMASKAAENANAPQIRNLAQAIIKTQTAQIQKLQQLSPVES
ncbi:DUF305 domain-containing protein [Anabaena sphaerica FACHB-251]|uniref:DUF305 domain-containing protein n=1 Tax=Anabaena sphaerica FACHB-251 TaxID=2692883 RepID=A0A926WFX4_9NOST|nr:DUF305 domain-containing protein [Anabaena sphaerica]MBD2293417.1 DUF305 domain-containing protein [Anabaena sphaerica FACHB-251]